MLDRFIIVLVIFAPVGCNRTPPETSRLQYANDQSVSREDSFSPSKDIPLSVLEEDRRALSGDPQIAVISSNKPFHDEFVFTTLSEQSAGVTPSRDLHSLERITQMLQGFRAVRVVNSEHLDPKWETNLLIARLDSLGWKRHETRPGLWVLD